MFSFHHQAKCATYWPKVNEVIDLCSFTVKTVSEKKTPEYILREFDILYKNEVSIKTKIV